MFLCKDLSKYFLKIAQKKLYDLLNSHIDWIDGYRQMIINNLDNSKQIKSQKFLHNKNLTPRIIVTPKEVDLKDFLFHYPVFKSNVAFGANHAEGHVPSGETQAVSHDAKMTLYSVKKALDFADSVNMYFRFKPDKKQIDAAASLYHGDDTIVTAPTGTGKTLIAEYIMKKNMAEGKDTVYTTPLKALSNEKYRDFCKMFGEENVGLLTGDIKINTSAPIQVMTTEIYRNRLMGESHETLAQKNKHLATVIYDEVHMINDPERGEIWETSIMYTPPHVQQVALSATVGNDDKFENYFNRILKEKKLESGTEDLREARLIHVSPKERHLPLKFSVYDDDHRDIMPLVVEKYDLAKLKKASKSDAEEPLFELQKAVLQDISKKANGEGNFEHGIEVLDKILTHKEGAVEVEKMEEDLVKKLDFEEMEAKRIASLLQDKSVRDFNNDLLERSKVHKSKFPQNTAATVIVSPTRLKNLLEKKSMPMKEMLALQMLDNKMAKNSAEKAKNGLERLKQITEGKDLPITAVTQKLISAKISREQAENITDALKSEIINTSEISPEIRLSRILTKQEKTPVIFFKFSKGGCDSLREEFLKTGESLLTDEEQTQVSEIVQKHLDKGAYLGADDKAADFLSGTAVHHAGKMPDYKELVEELAQKKLCKVIFATDTLGAGINVPAKTVVMTQLSKYSGANDLGEIQKRELTANEFHQMAGRAGRRGKDLIGNVIIMLDKQHPPECVYKVVTSPADNLISNFKPTYSFISHFITLKKTSSDIEKSVDRSFLRESLSGKEESLDFVMDEMKTKFKKMSAIVTKPEMGCFKGEEGNLVPTIKGVIAAKARGIDELLFANLMTETPLEKLAPDQLAAVACSLTEGNEKNKTLPVNDIDYEVGDVLSNVDEIKDKITSEEMKAGIGVQKFEPNLYDAQFVQKWAQAPEVNCVNSWRKIVRIDMKKARYFDEGDLFKSVNRTADIVKQMGEIADYIITNPSKHDGAEALLPKMKIISKNAEEALKRLKKPPVLDVVEKTVPKLGRRILL